MKEENKQKIDKKYFDLGDEDKEILKKFDLFYIFKLPRYKIARALLILEDRINKLQDRLENK